MIFGLDKFWKKQWLKIQVWLAVCQDGIQFLITELSAAAVTRRPRSRTQRSDGRRDRVRVADSSCHWLFVLVEQVGLDIPANKATLSNLSKDSGLFDVNSQTPAANQNRHPLGRRDSHSALAQLIWIGRYYLTQKTELLRKCSLRNTRHDNYRNARWVHFERIYSRTYLTHATYTRERTRK